MNDTFIAVSNNQERIFRAICEVNSAQQWNAGQRSIPSCWCSMRVTDNNGCEMYVMASPTSYFTSSPPTSQWESRQLRPYNT